ncbi:DNA-directed RNA polymerases I and III subunit RPAC2 [Lasiosphaeris hirsuta]|uniref:DNA-directed RNA polymerases I and III subunit RPAC2 n=1 Tax=Lasiosphaeris hirsuta TaxID=260670 RepID=A0AA40DP83_9PEZI|nr:DNA-directed RNA polymerases I and III subunit RPAC2 [Lasiosphaeris hirsuta]
MAKSKSRTKAPQNADEDDVVMQELPTSHQPDVQDDASMAEANGEDDADIEDEEEVEDDTQRVRLLPGSTPTAASFEFLDEGHTLGNALRYIIMKNPDVEFCAYAIPHPSEPKMNVRIQTYEGTTAIDALQKGLKDLQDVCDVVSDKFVAAQKGFKKKSIPP